MSTTNELNNRQKLYHIQKLLTEMDLEGDVQESSAAIPTDVLIIPVIFGEEEEEENEEPAVLTLTYIPGTEEYYEHISLLQLMVELPLEVDEDNKETLLGFLLRVNQQIGIGAYYIDEDNKIGIRHILTHARFSHLDEKILADNINLLLSMVNYTSEGVVDVLDGANPQEVLEELFG